MKNSEMKLKKTPSCPGSRRIKDLLDRLDHVNYGIKAVDVTKADGIYTDFVNDATRLVLKMDFERPYDHDAVVQGLALGELAVKARATRLDFDWIDKSPSGNGDTRTYVVRMSWKS